MVVHTAAGRGGVSARLVAALDDETRARNASALWLLTEGRALLHPSGVRDRRASGRAAVDHHQLTVPGLCPSSAALIRKPLNGVMA
jgi:hypothetical protein